MGAPRAQALPGGLGGPEEDIAEVTALFNERSSRADIVPAKTGFCAQEAVKDDSCC